MPTLSWVHLSDLHFSTDPQVAQSQNIVLNALLDDLKQFITDHKLVVDFIFVTGDIAFSGRKDEYDRAAAFFDQLLLDTKVSKDRLCIVPGNHDVDRKMLTNNANRLTSGLTSEKEVSDLLGERESKALILKRLEEYDRFVKTYFGGCQTCDGGEFFHVHPAPLSGRNIAVLGLNSAWLAGGQQDRGRLALGEQPVRDALKRIAPADFRIVLMHHPFEWLLEFDQDKCQPLLMDGCDLILHGHLHKTGAMELTTPDARAMIIAAGASYEERTASNRYNLVTLDLDTGRGTIYFREYSDQGIGFWTKDTRTYRNAPDGEFTFSLRKAPAPAPPNAPARPAPGGRDWGEAPNVGQTLYGRESEIGALKKSIQDGGCRLVAVTGMGGVGKTALAVELVRQIEGGFDHVFWREMRNAPPIRRTLEECLHVLSGQQVIDFPENDLNSQIQLVIKKLRETRSLLILDNFETLLRSGSEAGGYLPGYEGYGELVRRIAQVGHRSCLIITSREIPQDIEQLEGDHVQTLPLDGLSPAAGRKLLRDKRLSGEVGQINQLIESCAGNPLALKQLAATIKALFGNDIAAFLRMGVMVLGDIHRLLDEQFSRLSDVEAQVMYWLAIERERVTWEDLQRDIILPTVKRAQLIEAIHSLRRRSLIEASKGGLYTLQPVVMEYVIGRLIEGVYNEILSGKIALMARYALIQARAKEYIRESQTRLILKPTEERLVKDRGIDRAADHLKRVLNLLRSEYAESPGYAAGNVANLMISMRGELADLDFSCLPMDQAYLIGVRLRNVSFAKASLAGAAFTEPFGSIVAVAFNPDGKSFAAGTANNEIRIWNAEDRRPLLLLKGHTDWVRSIAFSPDGKAIASGSSDQTVRIWSAQGGVCEQILQGHTGIVRSVAFSPDGIMIASGSDDNTVRLWEAVSGRCLKTLWIPETSWVWSLAFSPDGRTLMTGNEDGTVRKWDIESATCLGIVGEHRERVRSIALCSNGSAVASSSDDGTILLWDAEGGPCESISFKGHTNRVQCVTFSPDNRILASASDDHTVRLWDVRSGQCVKILRGHSDRVRSVAFDPAGSWLISGGDDHLSLWDVGTGQCIRILQGYVNLTSALAFSPDGRFLVSGHYDNTVRVWDVDTAQTLPTYKHHARPVWSVAWSADGKLIASCGDDLTVRLWKSDSLECIHIMRGHTEPVMAVAFDPAGQTLASASLDGTVRLWNIGKGEQRANLREHRNRVKAVVYSPDGKLLATGSEDHTVKLWSATTGTCIRTLSGHGNRVTSVVFSPDGQRLASAGEDNAIILWDPDTGEAVRTLEGHSSRVWSLAFSPDNTILVSGSEDKSMMIWNVETGQCLKTVERSHDARIWSLAIDPSGRRLASSSNTIKLWDMLALCSAPQPTIPRTLECEKPFAGTDITGVTDLTDAEISSLRELGAFDNRSCR